MGMLLLATVDLRQLVHPPMVVGRLVQVVTVYLSLGLGHLHTCLYLSWMWCATVLLPQALLLGAIVLLPVLKSVSTETGIGWV